MTTRLVSLHQDILELYKSFLSTKEREVTQALAELDRWRHTVNLLENRIAAALQRGKTAFDADRFLRGKTRWTLP